MKLGSKIQFKRTIVFIISFILIFSILPIEARAQVSVDKSGSFGIYGVNSTKLSIGDPAVLSYNIRDLALEALNGMGVGAYHYTTDFDTCYVTSYSVSVNSSGLELDFESDDQKINWYLCSVDGLEEGVHSCICTTEMMVRARKVDDSAGFASTIVAVFNFSVTVTATDPLEPTPAEPTPVVKEDGKATLSIADIYVGETLKPVLESSTNSADKATIYYRFNNQDDSAYTTTVPTKAGSYVAKAVLPENDDYKEVTATTTFKISELPAPSYTISGTEGKNGWYTSDVTITPESGYSISTDGKTYSASLTYSQSTAGASLYFKKTATGATTAQASLTAINIDKLAPAVSNVQNNQTIYADSFTVNVMDINLSSIKVNGQAYTFTGNNASIELTTDDESQYTIEAQDKAGNKTTVTFTMQSEWKQDGTIIAGRAIKLKKGQGYKLGEGNWQVDGDDTVYFGGLTFYVKDDTTITFRKK